ncbi:MAG: NUDIX hydrolase [Phycisphaerales bacterium]|nr:NUDIX hydrolase [Phycisphaerales bacterium]
MTDSANRIPAATQGARRTLLHKGAKFDFVQVEYPAADGRMLTRQYVRHPGAVVILPILQTGAGRKVVLIRNQRITTGVHLWELPAGTREPAEPPDRTAARELVEETGYRAASFELLGTFYTSPGLSDELMWAYAATGLVREVQDLEDDEQITVHETNEQDVLGMVDRGELVDAKSMLTVLLAVRKGLLATPNNGK